MPELHWLAVIVAGVIGFFSGGLWYSKSALGRVWMREAGIDEAAARAAQKGHGARVFATGILLSIVSSAVLSWWIGPNPGVAFAVSRGAIAGAAFVAASFGVNYAFAQRSLRLWLIDGGYHVVQFSLIGLFLGLMR